MNVATKVTCARMFLIVPAMLFFVLAYTLPTYFTQFLIVSCFIFSLLSATDFIDGAIARKTHTVSDLGKFLDPLADKIVVVAMLFLLSWKSFVLNSDVFTNYADLIFILCSVLVISRELAIGVFRAIASNKGRVIAAGVSGKIKTVFLDVAIAVLIVAPLQPLFYWFGQIAFYIATILTVYSGIHMILKNKDIISDKIKPENKEDCQIEISNDEVEKNDLESK